VRRHASHQGLPERFVDQLKYLMGILGPRGAEQLPRVSASRKRSERGPLLILVLQIRLFSLYCGLVTHDGAERSASSKEGRYGYCVRPKRIVH